MKLRIISAVVALLIAMPLILLGDIYFKLLVIILGLLGLREMMNVRDNIPSKVKWISYLLFLIFMTKSFDLAGTSFCIDLETIILSVFVLFMPILIYSNDKKYNIEDALYLLGSIIFLSIAFNLVIIVRDESLMLMFYLLLIPVITDTFAYFGGSKFGKHKLLPSISPNKSVEGLIIGSLFGTVIPTIFYYFTISNSVSIPLLIVLTLFMSLTGQLGDLIFSSIKRHYRIKDFSNIIPGHGGILDRLDSIIFVIYAYLLISTLL